MNGETTYSHASLPARKAGDGDPLSLFAFGLPLGNRGRHGSGEYQKPV